MIPSYISVCNKSEEHRTHVHSLWMSCSQQVLEVMHEERHDIIVQPPPPGCPRAIYSIMVDCWLVHRVGLLVYLRLACRLSPCSARQSLAHILRHCRHYSSQGTVVRRLSELDIVLIWSILGPYHVPCGTVESYMQAVTCLSCSTLNRPQFDMSYTMQ